MKMSAYKVEKMNVIGGEKINLIGGEKVNILQRKIIPEDPPNGESKPKLTSFNDDWFKTKRSDFGRPIHHFSTEVAPQSHYNYIPRQEPDPQTAQLPPYGANRRPPYSTMKYIAPFPETTPTGGKSVNWPMLILLNILYILFTWVTAITRRSHLERQEEIKKQEEEKKRQENIKVLEEMKRRKRSKQLRLNKLNNKPQ